jgi:outer membrane protein
MSSVCPKSLRREICINRALWIAALCLASGILNAQNLSETVFPDRSLRLKPTMLLSSQATAPNRPLFPSNAQTLPELWERLAISEPTLLAAKAQARAVLARESQAFAQFLPQITATANTTLNHRIYKTTGSVSNLTNDWYNSNGSQLNLTQSLWKQANRVANTQARAATEQAVQQMLATQQDLLTKLVTTWAETHYARDALQAARAIEAAANQQLLAFSRGYSLGIYAIPQRDEAQSKLQQAIAERHAAESELFARHTALEQLVGPMPALGPKLIQLDLKKIPFGSLPPLENFTGELQDNNPTARAALGALRVAQDEVRKLQAQHGPSLDLVASIGRTAQLATGVTPGQAGFKNRLDNIGLQFNLPLYTGGAQSAKVREAVELETKVRYELEAAQRNAITQASQAWAQLRSAQSKLEAAEQAVAAGLSAQRLAVIGQRNGIKTPADELQAVQLIETARRDASRAYFDNIIGMAKLQAASGMLEENTLVEIQERLQAPTAFTPVPAILFIQRED